MDIYFGKTKDFDLLASHEIKAETQDYFGRIQPNDYAFIRFADDKANLTRLWKFNRFENREGNVYACFDDVFTFNTISTQKFASLKLFKIDTNLVIFTLRQAKGKGFFKIEPVDINAFLNAIADVNTFNTFIADTNNFRKIVFVANNADHSEKDIQLYKNGNHYKLLNFDKNFMTGLQSEFISDRYSQFCDFLKENNKIAADNKKYKAQKLVKKWLESNGTSGNLSLLNLWDFFCSKQEFRDKDDDTEAESDIEEIESSDASEKEKTMNNINDIIDEYIKNDYKQIILIGAPGTGKTFSAKKYTGMGSNVKFVQFHPSYDYADFVEGLRPVALTIGGNPTFVRIDGTFKKFCRMIVEENYKNKYSSDLKDIDGTTDEEKYNNFVEKYTQLENDNELELKKYFFIIDEINRADLGKVFGELMYCLESSYRGLKDKDGNLNTIETQYSNLRTHIVEKGIATELGFDCFAGGFFIPKNLYIIGTMNDIDRSVEAFDFALRRRFEWIDIKANDVFYSGARAMLPSSISDDKIKELASKVIAMNNKISDSDNPFMLTEAYHIGHVYFKSYDGTHESLEKIFKTNVTSILKEYVRGRNYDDVYEYLIKPCGQELGVL